MGKCDIKQEDSNCSGGLAGETACKQEYLNPKAVTLWISQSFGLPKM